MSTNMPAEKTVAPWQALRAFTPARVALGRAGGSLPTRAALDFRLAHARARDALLKPLDEERLAAELERACDRPVLRLSSEARGLDEYLRRPDLGRVLSPESSKSLRDAAGGTHAKPNFDLVLLISEGLSALAAEKHAASVAGALVPLLARDQWRLAPVCLVRRARVALQDHAGEIVGAEFALILVGERPGLISPDSLGAYLVHRPKRGNSDAQRNCVSNISGIGLTPADAARKLHWLLSEGRRRKISGVALKDESGSTRLIGKG